MSKLHNLWRASLLLALAVAGCRGKSNALPVPPVRVARDLELKDVERHIIGSQRRLVSMKLDCTVQFSSPLLRTLEPCRGQLLFRREEDRVMLRLTANRPLAGRAFEVGTDGSQIWIYNPDRAIAYKGRAGSYYDPEGTLGVFPDDLAEVFNIGQVFHGMLCIFEKQVAAYQIQLIQVDNKDTIHLFRRMTVLRDNLTVVGYEIFNPDNTVRAQIWLRDHKNYQGVAIPHRIQAVWPQARSTLVMVVNYVELNMPVATESFVLSPRKRINITDLDGLRPEVFRPELGHKVGP